MKKASLNMEKHPKLVQSHGSDNYESGDIDANKCIRKKKGPRQEEGPIYAKKLKKPKQAKSEEEFFIHESCKKESRDKVCEAISQWVCDASIPFDAVNYASFRTMMDSMGRCGVSIKPPSYREMWGPLLSKEANDMLDLIDSPEEDWARYGCSLRVDERTYQDERTIVNFLVSSPKGTHFLQSVDASDLSKYGEAMFHLIDFFIERIGETKVIQVVTDDATSNVLAVSWWSLFGASAPNLQRFAIKVLSLTCSASGFQPDWSIFEHLHYKKRNCLAQKRLNSSVFVKYNRMLRHRYDARDHIDPISYGYIDDNNEWLTGSMEGECDDDEDTIMPDNDLTLDVEFETENEEIEEFGEEEDENDASGGSR
ncbi:unnamed protein product [Cuscuta epithymum]|uniref:DUF659 domain-containing protein n=1 Tax=Cuscuta epithymum TaxID=186058 RepID=A0AAV0CED5_9ASTE|nr:unnamed protein product [Cuscuta epithymum]